MSMATFLDSIHIRHDDVHAVADVCRTAPALRRARLRLLSTDGWVSVYSDPPFGSSLLVIVLAELLAVPIIHLMVHGNSRAWCRLYTDGVRRAGFRSGRSKPGAKVPDLSAWRTVMPAESVRALLDVWDCEPALAEGLIPRSEALLGLEARVACARFEDFATVPGIVEVVVGDDPVIGAAPTGAPALQSASGPGTRCGVVGEPFSYEVTTTNVGGPGRGVRVLLGGLAARPEFVHIDAIGIAGVDAALARFEAIATDHDGRPFEVHADCTISSAPGGLGVGPRVVVEGRYLAPCAGAFITEVVPFGGTGSRSFHTVDVVARGRLPRHAAGDAWEALHRLWAEKQITAWVMFAGDAQTASRAAIDAMLAFDELVEREHAQGYERASSAPGGPMRRGKVEPRKLTRAVVSRLIRDADRLTLMRRTNGPKSSTAREPTDSMTLTLRANGFDEVAETFVPTLILTAPLSGRSEHEARALERVLVDIVNEVARTTPIDQAFVTRAGVGGYESACGAMSPHSSWRPWTTRFLRHVGSHMWLGADLRARIDRALVMRLARFEELAHGTVHITAEETRLDALEEVMDELLRYRA